MGGAYDVKKVMADVDKGEYVTKTFVDYDYDQIESYTYKLKKTGYKITSSKPSSACNYCTFHSNHPVIIHHLTF